MNHLHADIDAHAERCKAETRAIVQEALDRISIKVGFWIRSDAQKRRWEKAQKETLDRVDAQRKRWEKVAR